MTELDVENMTRAQLIGYLRDHVYPKAGAIYRDNVTRALGEQTTNTLLAMAKVTRKSELERQEKRRQALAALRKNEHKHTTEPGAP